ncbi:hypothetical protein GCM10029964_107190 [Kibdelosporangium lantanae]
MMQTSLTERDTQPVGRRPRPVFVDPTGRRRRVLRRVAFGLSALVACYAVVLLAATLGAPVPRYGFLPLPEPPTRTELPRTGAPPAGGGGAPTPDATREPVTVTREPSPSVVGVTSGVTPTGPRRPNSNANPTPPGLTKHSETHTHPNGPPR